LLRCVPPALLVLQVTPLSLRYCSMHHLLPRSVGLSQLSCLAEDDNSTFKIVADIHETSLSSDEDSLDEYNRVVYVPQGTPEKDRGNVQPCDAAGYLKRPFAVVTSEDKLNFQLVLSALERHLDMLLRSGPRSTQKLFKMLQPVPGEYFFLEGDLGIRVLTASCALCSGLQVSMHTSCSFLTRPCAMIQEVVGGGISVSRPDDSITRLCSLEIIPRLSMPVAPPLQWSWIVTKSSYLQTRPALYLLTAPSDSPPQNHNPAELHMPAPTSSLLGTCEVVPSAATDSAQVSLPCRQGQAKLTSMQSRATLPCSSSHCNADPGSCSLNSSARPPSPATVPRTSTPASESVMPMYSVSGASATHPIPALSSPHIS